MAWISVSGNMNIMATLQENSWRCSKRVGNWGRRIPLPPTVNLQFTQLRAAACDIPGKISLKSNLRPLLPFLLRVQQYHYKVPNSKSSEARKNVSYLSAWTNVCCGSILKDWIWGIFLGSPVAGLYKLLVIQCFLRVIQSDGGGLW